MWNTLTEIDTRLISNLAVSSDSTTYSQSRRRAKINSVIKRICDGTIVDILEQEKWNDKMIKWWDLRFLRKRQQIISYEPVTITDDEINSSTTTINTSSTANIPTAGNWYVWWSVFAYTGKTSTSLTWVTWLEGTHYLWDNIYIVTKLPTTCAKAFDLFRVQSDGSLVPTDYIDYKSQDYSESYRTTIWDSSATDQYVWMNFSDRSGTYRLYYFAKPTTLSSGSNTTEIPDDYWVELIALIASGELSRETEKRDQGKKQLVLWYAMLLEFYDKFIEQKKSFRKTVRQLPPKHGFVYQRRY